MQSKAIVWSTAEARLQAMTDLLAFYVNSGAWRIVCCTAYEEVGVRQRMG